MKRDVDMKPDAEQIVIGTVLRYPSHFIRAQKIIKGTMFAHFIARAAWTAIEQIEAGGGHATPDKAENAIIRADSKIRQDEVREFLTGCVRQADTENFEGYCEDIRDAHDQRTTEAELIAAQMKLKRGFRPVDVLGELQTSITKLLSAEGTRDFTTPEQNAEILRVKLEKIEAGEEDGIPTGFVELDALLTGGGFRGNDLIVIAAGSSVGKSALMASLISKSRHVPTGVVTIETSADDFLLRLMCCSVHVDMNSLLRRRLTDEQRRKCRAFSDELESIPLYIEDASFSVQDITLKARRMKAEHGIRRMFIDHLSDVKSEGRFESREREMKDIVTTLRQLSKPAQLDMTIIPLAQINREYAKRAIKCPQLSDLRESGTVEQEADVVLLIDRPERYNNTTFDDGEDCTGKARIVIAKQRNGMLGNATLAYLPKWTLFENLDSRHVTDYRYEDVADGAPF